MTFLFGVMIICAEKISSSQNTNKSFFESKAVIFDSNNNVILKTDVLPWLMTIPNIGVEYTFKNHWSANLDVWYCPWMISEKYSVKTAAVLPEIRYWLKSNIKGSFFNLHLNVAWYNVRFNTNRYQDEGHPLMGAGIGYGYRLNFSSRCGMEFNVGFGFAYTRYNRYYNIANGALADTRVTTYWGIDRAAITFVYYLNSI